MPIFRDPKNGQLMTLGDHETGGIKTLLRLGWHDVTPAPVLAPPVENEAPETPTSKPVKRKGR